MPSPEPIPEPEFDLDRLLREVGRLVHASIDEQHRLRSLLDAVVTMAGDLTLDGVLEQILKTARALTQARYAALGVLEPGPGRRLERFVHQGLQPDVVRRIGALPRGHGVLGVITGREGPLRLQDIKDHPSSFGFPGEHPPMRSFLGVPIRIHGRTFGNLYLTEKSGGGDFTPEDEGIVVGLAAAAGVAVENARLYAEADRRQRWLAADADVPSLLLERGTGTDGLQAVIDLARHTSEADVAWIASGETAGELVMRVVSGDGVTVEDLGASGLGSSLSSQAFVDRSTLTAADLDAYRGSGPAGTEQRAAVQSVIAVPLGQDDEIYGVLTIGWHRAHPPEYYQLDPSLLKRFADTVALSVRAARAQAAQRRVAVLEDRERIARDLHDLVIQRIFAVGLSLQAARRLEDAAAVRHCLGEATSDLDATVKDLRRSIFALANADASGDLQSEVTRIVDRAAATLKFNPTLRFVGPVRTMADDGMISDLLAVLSEALSNVTRHAGASAVWVTLEAGSELSLTVRDDGRGLPEDARLSGLANLRERARARGGEAVITGAPSEGTTIQYSVPFGR